MHTATLKHYSGHLFIPFDGREWLLDTGLPTSFGNDHVIDIAGNQFSIPDNYMGLTPQQVSEYVDHPITGMIGADLLNNFDVLIDLKRNEITFADDKIDFDGNQIEMDAFMGIPIVSLKIDGIERRMFFDTGAQISYFQHESLTAFPAAGPVADFYPGFGQFETETHWVEAILGGSQFTLRCGRLPEILGMTLMMAGTEGIVGNEIFKNKIAGYFPRRNIITIDNK